MHHSNGHSQPTVAVAILNWNGLTHLQTYLPSVIEHSPNAAVVVIDNGSTDDSLQWVTSTFPAVKVVRLPENLGFAGGYNAGLKQVQADVFVLLNSDVRVTRNWIEPVLEMMSSGYTACSPKLLNDSAPNMLEYAGAAGGHMDRDGFMFCAGRIFNQFESDHGQYDSNREVFWASGAALFIRSEAWHAVEGLDEDFFAHMEEIDLCWRLKNRGHRIGMCGKSNVFHLGGGTLQKVNPFKTYLNFRNNLVLLMKNHHREVWPWMIARRMALDGVAACKFLIEGNVRLFLAVFHAHMSFYGGFIKSWSKRNKELKSIKNAHFRGPVLGPNYTGWYRRSIVWDHYMKGRNSFQDLENQFFESPAKPRP